MVFNVTCDVKCIKSKLGYNTYVLHRVMYGISCKVMSACKLFTRISYDTRLASDSRAQEIFHAASIHSFVFGSASGWFHLPMMPSSLCGSPNCQSCFMEHDNLAITIHCSFESMIKVAGTPPNLVRLMLAHAVPSPCNNCYTIMATRQCE